VTDGATFLFSHEDLTYTQVSAGYRHTVLASEVTAVLMPADGMISDNATFHPWMMVSDTPKFVPCGLGEGTDLFSACPCALLVWG
jgi:hypothetical protein